MVRGRGRGRGKGSRLQKKDFGKQGARDDTWTDYRDRNVTFENMADRETNACWNEKFEEYYKEQKVCPPEEWDEFVRVLKVPLPISFRINGTGKFAKELRRRLESDFFSRFTESKLTLDGKECEPPRAMPWYPDSLAWQMSFSRAQLRKLPMLNELHKFINRENNGGSITRQEAVSMVPPLFLDVKPHHMVLDMCAAPGSKTFQLLEMLHAGPEAATGLIVANDSDAQRCNLLAHQTKRMCSPCLLVTNHEGQHFPIVRPCAKARHALHGDLKFDRILCDVPCSGDGTMRKAPDIWRRWSVNNGNSLHPLQLRITLQACRLLKVGGRLVYSTCTFNPVEDEAVLAAVLLATKGALRLVDVSTELPALKRLPGLSSWKVYDKSGWYVSWEEAEAAAAAGSKFSPTMFPSPATAELPLERALRFLPHHQDTGGFYVAVLEKVAECTDMVVPTASRLKRARNRPDVFSTPPAVLPLTEAPPLAPAVERGGNEETPGIDVALEVQSPIETEAVEPPEGAPVSEAQLPKKRVKVDGAGALPPQPSAANAVAEPAAEPSGESHTQADASDGAATAAAADPPPAAAPMDARDTCTELRWEVRGGGTRGRLDGARKWKGLDPIVPITDASLLDPVVAFYGLRPEFPLRTNMVTRCLDAVERPRRCYYVSPATRHALMLDESESLKVTSTGLKLLERQEVRDGSNPCMFRVSQEGLPFLLPYVTKQCLRLRISDFQTLVTKRALRIPKSVPYATFQAPTVTEAAEPAAGQVVSQPANPGGAAEDPAPAAAVGDAKQHPGMGKTGDGTETPLLECEDACAQLATVCSGCCIVMLREEDAEHLGLPVKANHLGGCLAAEAPLALSCWRTKNSLSILVSKPDCELINDKLVQLVEVSKIASKSAAETQT